MSHFAKVINGIVTEVIVAEKDFINTGAVGDEFLWVQCSYNENFRGKYPKKGYTWDGNNFYAEKPHSSWVLDSNFIWQAPVAIPEDACNTKPYTWNEETQSWDEVTPEV